MSDLQAAVTPRGLVAATEVYNEGRKSPRWKSILSFCFSFSEILPAHEKCFTQHANMISFPLAQGRKVPATSLSRVKVTGALWGAHSEAFSFLEKQNTLCLSPQQHVWPQVNSVGLMTALHKLNMETLKALIHIYSLRTYAQGARGVFVEKGKTNYTKGTTLWKNFLVFLERRSSKKAAHQRLPNYYC